ncbi:hypothetical protein GH714_039957 [Hevea brasiliensis]|uniref:Pentatricopeptide repeat-containing protein n=1 Tax=Hevea brasiliensis TaxID=3981 RepID=A0A6A6MTI5_HEVBR|nr:hypothetical protein GH714_039957 [Hevea brasiliensis]
MPRKTIISSNTMITLYSRNGEIDEALVIFERTKGEKNPVTWNSMLSVYIQNEQREDALKLTPDLHFQGRKDPLNISLVKATLLAHRSGPVIVLFCGDDVHDCIAG